ncbi:ankyrin repeat domain-containing protein [Noviherbaspirillum sp.]|uniref:ankyrin repeat domain-containing protein n=1 Tax=Noviherbaspirillum sp. TaxID=1926288 RepID=UPI002B464C91|nr:ankyrin repeat domain-containing protein [Noviherbaspirillum sp.]HJV82735.1 ankyrin repeat domain-containing protein [Noviherbaspirillum sp.]
MLKLERNRKRRKTIGMLGIAGIVLGIPGAGFAGAYDDFFRAVKADEVGTIKSLLARGLDPNLIEAERGDTGLILALRDGSMRVFELLLNAPDVNLEAKAFNGDTALMIACYKGNKAAVEALLAKGAEVNKPGWTPLHYAAAIGNNDIVQILLDKSAYIDAESPNKTTPIMMAARGGHILTVKLLLDEGADATLKNELGMSAIDFAEKHGHKDIAEGLTYRLKKAGKQ